MHQVIAHFNGQEAPPSSRSGVSQRRCRSSAHFSRFPPGTRYPARLPGTLDFRRGGFVLKQPLPNPPTDTAPQPIQQLPFRSVVDPPSDDCSSSVSTTTRELIRRHHRTLACLSQNRGWSQSRGRGQEPRGGEQEEEEEQEEEQVKDNDDVIKVEEKKEVEQQEEEEREEESEVLLTLSESSCSSTEEEEAVEEEEQSEEEEHEEEELEEDQLFAKDYLLRVRYRESHDISLYCC